MSTVVIVVSTAHYAMKMVSAATVNLLSSLGKCMRNFINKDNRKDSGNMTLTEFMRERYKTREDKDNIFCVGISDAEFRAFIIEYLLGEDWYVVDPLSQTQVNEIALYEILKKHSSQYRKECKCRK